MEHPPYGYQISVAMLVIPRHYSTVTPSKSNPIRTPSVESKKARQSLWILKSVRWVFLTINTYDSGTSELINVQVAHNTLSASVRGICKLKKPAIL